MLGAAETDPISTGNEKRLLKKKKEEGKGSSHMDLCIHPKC